MKFTRTVPAILAALLLFCGSVQASDLTLKVASSTAITLTNNLTQPVYLTALLAEGQEFPILMQLGAGKSKKAGFKGAIPPGITARAMSSGGKPLPGHTPDANGNYELSIFVE